MATYTQLDELMRDDDLMRRVRVAILVAIDTVRTEPVLTANHAQRLVWAKAAVGNLAAEATNFLRLILAVNKDVAVPASIQQVTDAQIQTQVDNLVDFFAV